MFYFVVTYFHVLLAGCKNKHLFYYQQVSSHFFDFMRCPTRFTLYKMARAKTKYTKHEFYQKNLICSTIVLFAHLFNIHLHIGQGTSQGFSPDLFQISPNTFPLFLLDCFLLNVAAGGYVGLDARTVDYKSNQTVT